MKRSSRLCWSLILGLSACGGNPLEAPVSSETLVAALPTSEMLVIPYPETSAAADQSSTRMSTADASCEAEGEEAFATFYTHGCGMAHYVNWVVNDVLSMLANVTSDPPSQSDENVYLWGPYENEAEDWVTTFLMERRADGAYEYVTQAKHLSEGDDAWLSIVTGRVEAGVSETLNVGEFVVSYDNMATLTGDSGGGIALFSYDRLDLQTAVEATMEGLVDEDGISHDIVVDYDVYTDGSGVLRYALTADIYVPDGEVENQTLQETARINTRWQPTGAGRADLTITDGDLGETVAYRSQCWGVDYVASYQVSYYEAPQTFVEEGDSSQCVYETPLFL